MNINRLIEARTEAVRFLQQTDAAEQRILAESSHSVRYSKETAALRRASMDLTRALARLRAVGD